MSPLQLQFDRIRRRRWLVLAVTLVALVAAIASSRQAETTYTGKSTLAVFSEGRGPEQDANLARGYVDTINDPSSKAELLREAGIAEGVELSARTAATSPIIYIEATASTRALAQEAATKVATTYRTEINAQFDATTAASIRRLEQQLNERIGRLARTSRESPAAQVLIDETRALREQLNDIQTNTDNRLIALQPRAGTTESTPSTLRNLILGLIGGLILGCVAALALASIDDRLTTPHEVRERLDLDTLATIRGGGSEVGGRTQRLQGLANVINLSDLSRPATLAITTPRSFVGKSQVARGVATFRAVQGERTLLMETDLHRRRRPTDGERPGVAELLTDAAPGAIQRLAATAEPGKPMLLTAGASKEDPYALFSRERFGRLVGDLGPVSDLIVIDAPAIIEAAEGQVICAAADRTILVIEEGITKAADAQEACQLLEQVGATILGVVICRSAAERPGVSARRPADPGRRAAKADETEVDEEGDDFRLAVGSGPPHDIS